MNALPIVLTGTIIPNIPDLGEVDIARRRDEYLKAIDFYATHSEAVYFLENSSFDLATDSRFARYANLHIRKLPMSENPERGKGYQEFQMLDEWITSESPKPSRWIKITGRYIIPNVSRILTDCEKHFDQSLIIDQVPAKSVARSYLFCTTTDFYLNHFKNLYQECDDRTGQWVERVLYRSLSPQKKSVRFFPTKPDLHSTIGNTGNFYPRNPISNSLKQWLRNLNQLLDKRYLWFAR